MKIRNPVHLFIAFAMALLMSACATKPVTTEDYVQSARAQVGGVYKTIGDLKAQHTITQAQAKNAIAKTEVVETQIDTAVSLLKDGKPTTAQATVQLALNALLLIQSELKGK